MIKEESRPLCFVNEKVRNDVEKRAKRALAKGELDIHDQWLGAWFSEKIDEGAIPAIEIRYVNEAIGYGVFATKPFSKGAFIGEYTGLVRKRSKKNQNDYCFEYSIGQWARNPYIIDAKDHGNYTRYINHSERGNLTPHSVFAHGVMHIVLIANRSIEVGCQLSYDYGDAFWEKRRKIPSEIS